MSSRPEMSPKIKIEELHSSESQWRDLQYIIPNEKSATRKKIGRFLDKLDTEGSTKRNDLFLCYLDRR